MEKSQWFMDLLKSDLIRKKTMFINIEQMSNVHWVLNVIKKSTRAKSHQ